MSAKSRKTILVINGPNLNLLGKREPEIYGTTTLAEIEKRLRRTASEFSVTVDFFQSNSEGAIIDFLHKHFGQTAGILINPGALTHYGYALYDALLAMNVPIVEVHLSNLHRREEWRRQSVVSPASTGVIMGFGAMSYELGMQALLGLIK